MKNYQCRAQYYGDGFVEYLFESNDVLRRPIALANNLNGHWLMVDLRSEVSADITVRNIEEVFSSLEFM